MAWGGHRNAGTCQIPNEVADETLRKIIEKIHAQGLTAVGAAKASCATAQSAKRAIYGDITGTKTEQNFFWTTFRDPLSRKC